MKSHPPTLAENCARESEEKILMKTFKLPATLQKDYYGKAVVINHEETNEIYLKSYDTLVCKIDEKGLFVRLWGGYSVTTMKHINDFRLLYGLEKINKKEWLSLPCGYNRRYRILQHNALSGLTHKAGPEFDNEEDAYKFAESLESGYGTFWWYEVEEI